MKALIARDRKSSSLISGEFVLTRDSGFGFCLKVFNGGFIISLFSVFIGNSSVFSFL